MSALGPFTAAEAALLVLGVVSIAGLVLAGAVGMFRRTIAQAFDLDGEAHHGSLTRENAVARPPEGGAVPASLPPPPFTAPGCVYELRDDEGRPLNCGTNGARVWCRAHGFCCPHLEIDGHEIRYLHSRGDAA